jgi:CYTH domain-containing protein
MLNQEVELTFLPNFLPKEIFNSPSKEILDIYFPTNSKHPVLRLRKSGEKFEMTKKEPVKEGDSSVQTENTIPLTKDEYLEFSTLKGKRVEKIRYYYKENGQDFEVGIFGGELKGLVLIDVEFSSIEEKEKFKKPDWLGDDVTEEDFVAGGMLCGKKYEDIESDLNRFSYKKI